MKKIFSILLASVFLASSAVCFIPNTNKAYAVNASHSDKQLLARAVNGEARGEPYEGQVAVAAVILNRVRHSSFPNTIAGVIYQPGAFTAVSDGQINVPIDENSTVYRPAPTHSAVGTHQAVQYIISIPTLLQAHGYGHVR